MEALAGVKARALTLDKPETVLLYGVSPGREAAWTKWTTDCGGT
jgi:hypothetical protein